MVFSRNKLFFILLLIFLQISFIFASDIDSEDFSNLRDFFFKRYTPQIQKKCLNWKNDYIMRCGPEVFDNLIERYMRTKEFKNYSYKSKKLQSTQEAKNLKIEIKQIRSDYEFIKSKYSQYYLIGLPGKMRTKNSENPFRNNSAYVNLMRNVDESREFYLNHFNTLFKRYNKLVSIYNKKYLGNLPFLMEK